MVAEGVETAPTWDALRDMGCDIAQGYLISRPIAGADLRRMAACERDPSVPRFRRRRPGRRGPARMSTCIPVLTRSDSYCAASTQDDFEAFAAIVADPEVVEFLDDGEPIDREACWRGMAIFLGHWHLRGYGWWAVEDRRSGEFLGRIGLYNPEGWPGIEIGWLLRRDVWGSGLATEGAAAALDFAFDVVGADHVISIIDARNVRSIRVAEKLGERYETNVRQADRTLAVYGIDRRRASG